LFHYCCVTTAPIRAERRHQAEQISQALWGEVLEVLDTNSGWSHVRCSWDGYTGWLPQEAISPVLDLEEDDVLTVSSAFAEVLDLGNGSILVLSMGSRLRSTLLPQGFQLISGTLVKHQDFRMHQAKDLADLGLSWIGTPYWWGGRSRFGVDCSGFTQVMMARMGHYLPRDAKDQWASAKHRQEKPEVDSFEAGQLAFFGPSVDCITHVGLVLSPDKILHASVRVRVDTLSHQGIFATNSLKENSSKHKTHTLQGIATYTPF
jgi:hypothetical protein